MLLFFINCNYSSKIYMTFRCIHTFSPRELFVRYSPAKYWMRSPDLLEFSFQCQGQGEQHRADGRKAVQREEPSGHGFLGY